MQERNKFYAFGEDSIDSYMARRAKQIEDQHVARAFTTACIIATLLSLVGLIVTTLQGSWLVILFILLTVSCGIGGLFLWFLSRGLAAANVAVEKEYERVQALYAQAAEAEKPKRGGRDISMHLADDGELMTDALETRDVHRNSSRADV